MATKYSAEQLDTLKALMRDKCVDSFHNADESTYFHGISWYENANAMLQEWAEETSYSLEIVAGVFAVMSANKSYRQNVISAWNLLNGLSPQFGTTEEHDKCHAIMAGDLSQVKGPKVSQFYLNLLHPMLADAVTIDTIMCGFVGMRSSELDRKGVREALKNGVREAASIVRLRPNQIQAIAWIYFRGSHA